MGALPSITSRNIKKDIFRTKFAKLSTLTETTAKTCLVPRICSAYPVNTQDTHYIDCHWLRGKRSK